MTDMCLRIDGLPHDTWGYTLLPFQGEHTNDNTIGDAMLTFQGIHTNDV